jgi:hypothetical protein
MQKRRVQWLWVVLVAVVLVVVIPTILFGFLLFQNEPSPTDPARSTEVTADLRALDEGFLGVRYPASASLVQRYGDERGIDKLLVVSFEANEAEAVAYVQSLTGRRPQPGFSIQDLDVDWWKRRPAKGRGAASDPAFSPVAKRVLLSKPTKEGKTSVWVMANET